MSRLSGIGLACIAAISLSAGSLLSGELMLEVLNLNHLTLQFLSSLLASIVLFLIYIIGKKQKPGVGQILLALLSGACLAASWWLYNQAVFIAEGSSVVHLVYYTFPFLVFVQAAVIKRFRFNAFVYILLLLLLLGQVLIIGTDTFPPLLAYAYVLASALTLSWFFLCIGLIMPKKGTSLLAAISLLGAAISFFLLIFIYKPGTDFVPENVSAMLLILITGAAIYCIPIWCFYLAQKTVNPGLISAVSTADHTLRLIILVLLYGAIPSPIQIAGIAIVLLTLLLMSILVKN